MKTTLISLALLGFFLTACHVNRNIIKVKGSNKMYSSIADAVDSSASGSTLIIYPGKYTIDDQLWVTKDSFTLKGKGNVEILCTNMESNVIWIGGTNITIKNIKAKHIKPGFYAECTGNVIYIDMGENIHIENCDLNGCGRIGINIQGGSHIVIRKNLIHDNTECAVKVDNIRYFGTTNDNPEKVRFIDNTIYNNGQNN